MAPAGAVIQQGDSCLVFMHTQFRHCLWSLTIRVHHLVSVTGDATPTAHIPSQLHVAPMSLVACSPHLPWQNFTCSRCCALWLLQQALPFLLRMIELLCVHICLCASAIDDQEPRHVAVCPTVSHLLQKGAF